MDRRDFTVPRSTEQPPEQADSACGGATDIIKRYRAGESLRALALSTGMPRNRIRQLLIDAGEPIHHYEKVALPTDPSWWVEQFDEGLTVSDRRRPYGHQPHECLPSAEGSGVPPPRDQSAEKWLSARTTRDGSCLRWTGNSTKGRPVGKFHGSTGDLFDESSGNTPTAPSPRALGSSAQQSAATSTASRRRICALSHTPVEYCRKSPVAKVSLGPGARAREAHRGASPDHPRKPTLQPRRTRRPLSSEPGNHLRNMVRSPLGTSGAHQLSSPVLALPSHPTPGRSACLSTESGPAGPYPHHLRILPGTATMTNGGNGARRLTLNATASLLVESEHTLHALDSATELRPNRRLCTEEAGCLCSEGRWGRPSSAAAASPVCRLGWLPGQSSRCRVLPSALATYSSTTSLPRALLRRPAPRPDTPPLLAPQHRAASAESHRFSDLDKAPFEQDTTMGRQGKSRGPLSGTCGSGPSSSRFWHQPL